jgi:hypothetical protein
MKYTIFSVDHDRANAFIDFIFFGPTLKGNIIYCRGCYKGHEERSYIALTEDFEQHIRHQFCRNQESFLRVSECNKQYARLDYADGRTVFLGSVRRVPEKVARSQDAWTYRPDTKEYWITVQGNPEHSLEQLGISL